MESVEKVNLLFEETRKLIGLYELHNHTIPFGLKGNLGEFHVQQQLLERFPASKPKLLGGSHPTLDIEVAGVRIQVKTQVKLPPTKFRGGCFDFESSPTIKKTTFEKDNIDILTLVIVYPGDNFTSINQIKTYVFDRKDFCYFRSEFCWSGKSKGDKTIVNVLGLEGIPPKKLKESIDIYNTPEYRQLFVSSLENWNKIEKAALEKQSVDVR